jgi:phosphohistidine phosphatase SixA
MAKIRAGELSYDSNICYIWVTFLDNSFFRNTGLESSQITNFRNDLEGESRLFFMRTLLAVFLFCNFAIAQQSVRTIYLVRHAEKTSSAADATLSPAGMKRAACLANTLKDAGIKQIYVTEATRTQQTADPLAKQLKITPTITKSDNPGDLVRNLFYAGSGNTLVVGHSNTLPVVIARMKAGTIKPIGDNEYDRLFLITTMEGSSTPVVTLHYCESSSSATAPDATQHMAKPAAKKAPAKK